MRDLMAVDVRTGQSRMLLEDARIGEIAFNPADRSLIGVRHAFGYAVLVRIPYPYTEWKALHVFPYGVVPYDLDISPDGKLLSASVAEVNGDQFLRVWPLAQVEAGDMTPLSGFRFGQSVPENFVFSRDGRYLYGSSYYTGVSNIFRYEVATGFVPAVIDPKPVEDASAIRFLGTAVTEKHPEVTKWQVDPPSAVDDEKLVLSRGSYAPTRHMALDNAFPVLQGYKDFVGAGYHFNFADPLGFAQVGVTAAITPYGNLPRDEWAHVMVKGRYLEWSGAVAWNRSDFYDLFGPTKRSLKGLAVTGGYEHYIIYDDPRSLIFVGSVGYYDKIDTLPGAQNVDTTFARLLDGQVGLNYRDVRRSLGAVDDEKGILWSTYTGFSYPSGNTSWNLLGTLDYGWDLPLPNSSIWLRTAAGYHSGDAALASANFYFGSFGNNYVDDGSIKRYREWSKMPGFGIDEISAQTFARSMLEWNITPYVFESVGTPAFHLTWLRPALFATALWGDPESRSKRKLYGSIGGQVDLRFSVLHWYDMTFSVGYAVGLREGRKAGNEVMVSLKIM
jgi:hypothetical protein